jgi:two-component system response regulator FlrC
METMRTDPDLSHTNAWEEAIAQQLVGHTFAEVERVMILKTLDYFDGNRTRACAALGISVRCLRDKIHQLRNSGAVVPPPVTAASGPKGLKK